MTTAFFRANVGIVLHDDRGRVLSLERIDYPGTWQFPQGGIDQGEDVLTAALRELEEETGVPPDRVRIVAEHPRWLVYVAPRPTSKMGLGQAQKWVLAEFRGTDEDIRFDRATPEFRASRWDRLESVAADVVSFKREVYSEVLREFGPLLKGRDG